jgi:hypothetical protein
MRRAKRTARPTKSTTSSWNALVVTEKFQPAQNRSRLEICLLNNRVNGSTERKTSGVSCFITSPCGRSMGVTSADTASATTLCAGNKSLRSTEPESSLRARRDGGHSTHRFYQRHAWRWRGFIQGGAKCCASRRFPPALTQQLRTSWTSFSGGTPPDKLRLGASGRRRVRGQDCVPLSRLMHWSVR